MQVRSLKLGLAVFLAQLIVLLAVVRGQDAAPAAAPVDEMPPAEKPEGNVVWIGGYWGYDDDRKDFLWVSGVWRTPPPSKQWIAGYWREEGEQWQWVPGFWA